MAMFFPTQIKIFKIDQEITDIFNKKQELLAEKKTHTRMWEVPLQDNKIIHQPQQNKNHQKINNIYEIKKSADIVKYLCKAAFNPVPSNEKSTPVNGVEYWKRTSQGVIKISKHLQWNITTGAKAATNYKGEDNWGIDTKHTITSTP